MINLQRCCNYFVSDKSEPPRLSSRGGGTFSVCVSIDAPADVSKDSSTPLPLGMVGIGVVGTEVPSCACGGLSLPPPPGAEPPRLSCRCGGKLLFPVRASPMEAPEQAISDCVVLSECATCGVEGGTVPTGEVGWLLLLFMMMLFFFPRGECTNSTVVIMSRSFPCSRLIGGPIKGSKGSLVDSLYDSGLR